MTLSLTRIVSQTIELYSSIDLTSARYAVFLDDSGQCLRLRLMNPRVEFAFSVILVIWELHFRSSENVTPKYGLVSTC